MTNKDLFSALGGINPAWIEDAAPKHKTKKAPVFLAIFLPTAATAAAAILVFFLLIFPKLYPRISPTVPPADSPMQEPSINQSAPLPDGNFTELTAELTEHTALNGVISVEEGVIPDTIGGQTGVIYRLFGLSGQDFVLIAKAVEELPGTYRDFSRYGSAKYNEYRIFKMRITDPLETKLTGEFYFALPAKLKGDLTNYDAILLSMEQLGKDCVLVHTETGVLSAFSYLFQGLDQCPHWGELIPFNNGVFDDSLWKEEGWIYPEHLSDESLLNGPYFRRVLVKNGTTLKEALATFYDRSNYNNEYSTKPHAGPELKTYDYSEPDAKAAMEFMKPFQNGVFQREYSTRFRRYINGCATNETIEISYDTHAVTHANAFTEEEIAALPDLSATITALKIPERPPQLETHDFNITVKYSYMYGWYEKTESGVYSIIKTAWFYTIAREDYFYLDETFLLVTDEGTKTLSRKELTDLIGENRNISKDKYGSEIFEIVTD